MSNNYHEKFPERNEAADSFNLSKEELMNCFGSQIASQSSKSNYDYQNEYNPPNEENNSPENTPFQNLEGVNKDSLLKNICHGFIDMFFSQKEELKGIKDEIKKLQNIIINNGANNGNNNNISFNNNGNKRPINKKAKNNNQRSLMYNQNNIFNNNENYNYNLKNSKKNPFLNSSNNTNIFDDCKNQNKRQFMPLVANPHKLRTKSPNILTNPKSNFPETVKEVDEEYELTTMRKLKNSEENENKNNKEISRNNFEDLFFSENAEFKFEDINDDEFDEILKRGKNFKKNKMKMNDPFKKSSELKKKPALEEQKENMIENIEVANDENKKKGNYDFDLDIENDDNSKTMKKQKIII